MPALPPTSAPAAPKETFELRGPNWEPIVKPSTAPVTDETLDRVESLIEERNPSSAKKLAVQWLRSHKASPIRDRGLYLLGEANFRYGNRIMSFFNFDELMDFYPESPFFYKALSRQYDIADAFLNGYKRRFLGFWAIGSEDEAVEMLYRIQQRSPGSPLAEKALLRTSDYYYASADYDLASDAYAVYIHDYPRSPEIPRVKLRRAFSSLARFRGPRFDATPVIDAREQLVDVMNLYPDLARDENLPAMLQRIDDTLSRKLYITADFYRRTGQAHAEAYVYRYLIKTYPASKEADDARTRLQTLPQDIAIVPTAGVESPATAPAREPQ